MKRQPKYQPFGQKDWIKPVISWNVRRILQLSKKGIDLQTLSVSEDQSEYFAKSQKSVSALNDSKISGFSSEMDDELPLNQRAGGVPKISMKKNPNPENAQATPRSRISKARSSSVAGRTVSRKSSQHDFNNQSAILDQTNPIFPKETLAASASPTTRKLETFLANKGLSAETLKIVDSLGKGAAGEVFRVSFASQTDKLSTAVQKEEFLALKVIQKDRFCDLDVFRRIVERECENMMLLEDIERLPRFHQVVHFEQESYVFMELISGKKLSKIFKERKSLNPQAVLHISAQVAQIMRQISLKQVMYSDLKPDNIIVTPDGNVTLIDFGSAKKCIVTDSGSSKTSRIQEDLSEKEMEGIGTPEYMAPEYYSEEGLCLMSDVWSFGVLIHFLVCSTTPFFDSNPVALRSKVLQMNIEKLPNKFNDAMYQSLKDLIKLCLQKDPQNRPAWDDIVNHRALDKQTEHMRKAGQQNLALLVPETQNTKSGAKLAGEQPDQDRIVHLLKQNLSCQ